MSIRAESPEIEVIEVSRPMKRNVSQLSVYHPDISNALVPVQSSSINQPSFQSFMVSPTSHLLKEVSFLPATTVPVKTGKKRKPILSKKNRWSSIKYVFCPFR